MDANILQGTGLYIACPTSTSLKLIHVNSDTRVNNQHINIGKTTSSFESRKRGYLGTFSNEVEFLPVVLVDATHVKEAAALVLAAVSRHFPKVSGTQNWFHTTERLKVVEIISDTLHKSGLKHELIA